MLKITHILYSGLGGTSDVCQILCKLDKEINSRSSLIQVGPKKFSNSINSLKNKTHFVKTYRFLTFFYFFPVLKKLIKEKPNLIFLHNFQIIPVLIYKIFSNKKSRVFYIDHTPLDLKNFKDFIVCNFFKSIIDFFVVLNKDSYFYFLNKIKVNSKKIKIIPNAVNKEFIQKERKKKIKKNSLIIGMASRINKLKRHDLIIEAIQHSDLRDYKIKCFFAGDGENLDYLKSLIKDKSKFKFFGKIKSNKLKKWYNYLDVYIQATNGEGHSTSILQAMGMNLPIFASNVSGIKNFLIPKKKIGLTFENNTKSLINLIKIFIKMGKYKRSKIIKSQKKYILKNYSEDILLSKYLKIIKKFF